MKNLKQYIEEQKQHHKQEMDNYEQQCREFVREYEYKYCDYLVHKIRMMGYHRGALNALNELEKNL